MHLKKKYHVLAIAEVSSRSGGELCKAQWCILSN